MPDRKVLISLAILLIIGLHAVPVLYRAEQDTLWPFLHWAMYKESHPAGPVKANKRQLIAISAQGEQAIVTPPLVGLSSFVLQRRYVRPWAKGDTAAAQALIDRLNTLRPDPIVELRMESTTYTVTDTGLVKQSNPPVTYRARHSASR
jgi:hypothetical protein